MSIGNRPYVGSWKLNNRTLVRQVPDAIVYINGYTELASCASCSKRIDMQQYISQVSCDVSTDPISTANLSFKIPKSATELFDRDGNFILKPGLEIIILYRGYFPTKDYAGRGQDPDSSGFDADDVSVYPYYQCFRGVSTEVSHEYSGGFYSGSMSCANLLHMWQNLKVSTNGAAFGKRPANSAVQPHLIGHKFTGANPYSVVYTLSKLGFGAAYGVEFQISQSTNIAATNDAGTNSLYAHAAEWWEKRWQESSGRLRMYGINGRIFNDLEQAYLGRWYDSRDSGRGVLAKTVKTVREMYKRANGDKDFNSLVEIRRALRESGYDRMAVAAGAYATSSGKRVATEDVVRMQAFNLDIGKMGGVNMFETEYVSKLDIVNQVCEITGFEFYQDADGDLVFKPPMYNLDTREDPVYVIKDRDLISIDESESEPEVTMMKGTGSQFANLSGHGVDGFAGVGAIFIDYKLVAQFGYKEESFECNYFNSKHSLFMSAMNRLDLANIGMRSGSISIPMRPELRPGYPVYVESEDCFYYVKSVSHSFSYGGEATTNISWVAKRRKFMPPIQPNDENRPPKMKEVRLDAPGEYPAMPLVVFPEDPNSADPPRIMGFPNVIMALDVDKLNYETVDLERGTLSAQGFIEMALSSGFLERGNNETEFLLRKSDQEVETVPLSDLKTQWNEVANALSAGTYKDEPSNAVGRVISLMQSQSGFGVTDIESAQNLVNYLAIQNSLTSQFSPGSAIAGRYRYYSCSHPDPSFQAPRTLLVDQEKDTGQINTPDPEEVSRSNTMLQFQDGEYGPVLKRVPISNIKAVSVKTLSDKSEPGSDKREATNLISSEVRFVVFSPQRIKKKVKISATNPSWSPVSNFAFNLSGFYSALQGLIYGHIKYESPSETYGDRFSELQEIIDYAFEELAGNFESTRKIQRAAKSVKDYLKRTIFTQKVSDTRRSDKRNVKAIAEGLSSRYKAYLSALNSQGKKELKANSDRYQELMSAKQLFFNTIFGEDTVADPNAGVSFASVENIKDLSYYTPVFPVSDAGGYEVIGNLPYGRGLQIATYAELLSSTKESSGGSPEEVANNTETVIGSRGVNAINLGSVEQLLLAYVGSGGDLEGSLNIFDEETKNAILATNGYANEAELGAYLESIVNGSVSEQAKIRNTPVTSYSRGQSIYGDTAALNLANISTGGGVCACKGSDGLFLLEAFNRENILLFGEEAVTEYQKQQAEELTVGWKITKDAYTGTSTRRDTELSELVKNPSSLYGPLLNETRNQINEITEEGGEE